MRSEAPMVALMSSVYLNIVCRSRDVKAEVSGIFRTYTPHPCTWEKKGCERRLVTWLTPGGVEGV